MIKEASKEITDSEVDQIDSIVNELRTNFLDNRTQDLTFRKSMLQNIVRGMEELEKDFTKALNDDMRLDETTAYLTNILLMKNDAIECASHLSEWCKPRNAPTPLPMWPGSAQVKPQPRGLVLVMGSWNFPLSTIAPFISAIAAGNCVIIKPSEFAPATSRVLRKLFEKYLDRRYYRCIEGAVQTSIKLTNTPFDLICFTGSTFTGKLIAKAAAAHLTPLILELGGKCPTVVDRNANIQLAARRIIAGKFTNCGQVCIAPDYIYAHKEIMSQLVTELKKQIEAQFSKEPKTNPNYSRLIHEAHVKRTSDLLKGHEDKIAAKYGEVDVADRFFPPTILISPEINSQLMQEEIFGPILPIYPYDSPVDVIDFIRKQARPLAVYYYGEPSSIVRQRLEEGTVSGGFVVNDSVVHFGISSLPFGGIGDSGYGTTHGRAGFEQFCNLRAVFERPNSTFLDTAMRYASTDGTTDRVKLIKKIEFATRINVETVTCYAKSALLLAFFSVALWLAVKYRIVAFPFLGIGSN